MYACMHGAKHIPSCKQGRKLLNSKVHSHMKSLWSHLATTFLQALYTIEDMFKCIGILWHDFGHAHINKAESFWTPKCIATYGVFLRPLFYKHCTPQKICLNAQVFCDIKFGLQVKWRKDLFWDSYKPSLGMWLATIILWCAVRPNVYLYKVLQVDDTDLLCLTISLVRISRTSVIKTNLYYDYLSLLIKSRTN